MTIPTMAEMVAEGKTPEILFWVGCAGSYDARAQKVSAAFAKILTKLEISFAILGQEEVCTGDPARRAGNEFIFQMLANQNVQTLNGYGIKKIVATCPHCFNTLKNEYPDLGGNYEVVHHTQYLNELLKEGKLKIQGGTFKGQKITYHDSCYMGRINGEYEAPRELMEALDIDLVEMKRSRKTVFVVELEERKCLRKMNQEGNVSILIVVKKLLTRMHPLWRSTVHFAVQ